MLSGEFVTQSRATILLSRAFVMVSRVFVFLSEAKDLLQLRAVSLAGQTRCR
jgi:hypothetical protein